jgi:signal transduction histidine kinase/CheY-like chemotaxis protein
MNEVTRRIRGLNEDRQAAGAMEQIHVRLDGSQVTSEVSAIPTEYLGKPGGLVFVRDITARKDLEAQLFQAQKMEAVGRLAGGVAHDFNNMLQTILGYTNLAMEQTDPEDEVHDHLTQVNKAARRSADLTKQLLGFARKQVIEPQLLDLNDGVADLLKMLHRLIGEDIDLLWRPCEEACPVLMDSSQMNQVLANLVVNARDAIPGVGRITIETAHVCFDEEYCRERPGFQVGEYEMLAVSDDGQGMDEETRARAFEPFFTTKGKDQGTGLGLAMVYGIVKQNQGFINVYSEPGQGTTIRIYLKTARGVAQPVAEPEPAAVLPTGDEVILLVEDELELLKLSQSLLEKFGYKVIAMSDPLEALALAEAGDLDIDLLMTDVIMPNISGKELWDQLRNHMPQLPCLFMSGYTSNVIAHRGVLDEGINFLQKPFSRGELADKLREALSRSG